MILNVLNCYFDTSMIWSISELGEDPAGNLFGSINCMTVSPHNPTPEDKEQFRRDYIHLLQVWVAGRKEILKDERFN